MKPFVIPATALLALAAVVLLLALLVGCATARSDTQRLKESAVLRFTMADTTSVKAHALGVGDLAAVAAEYGVRLAKQLIDREAKRYGASASATDAFRHTKMQFDNFGRDSQMTSGGYFVFLRTVRDPGGRKTALPPFDAAERDRQARIIAELLGRHLTGPADPAEVARVLNEAAMTGGGVERAVLTFCAVGLVRQRESQRTFELQLLGYTYPALKAKNAKFPVPFTKWHQAQSLLTVTIEGPAALGSRTGAESFAADASFEVRWDREAAGARKAPEWVVATQAGTPLARSRPIAVPPAEDFVLTAAIAESSDMTATLDKAAEAVGKWKP